MNLSPDTGRHLCKAAALKLKALRFASWLVDRTMVRARRHRQSVRRRIRYRRTPAAVGRVRYLRKSRTWNLAMPKGPF